MSNRKIEAVAESIKGLIGNIQNRNCLEDNIRAIINAVITKLDLVSREEFDTQQMVLIATRKKLDELEKMLKKASD